MSAATLTHNSAIPLVAVPDVVEVPARFRDVVAAEWIKLWSLRSTYWVLGLAAVAIVGFNVNSAYTNYNKWDGAEVLHKDDFMWGAANSAFTSNASMILVLIAGCVGASVVVSEHSSGLIRTTFVAVPARRSVLAAKVAVVAPVFTVFGAVVATASFGVTQAILAGKDIGMSITDPGAWQIVVSSALLAPVAALVGLAAGAVIRHTATAMVATPFLLLVLPTFLTEDRHLSATVRHAMVLPARQRLLEIGPIAEAAHGTPYYSSAAGAWIVYATWALAAAAIATTALHRRDV